MSKLEVDAIEPQSGTTLTLGASGDTVNLASGATAGFGKVGQVITASTSTDVSNTTNTYADTGLTATITPSSTSSKILVTVQQYFTFRVTTSSERQAAFKLLRDSTELKVYFYALISQMGSADFRVPCVSSYSYLDSPNTTSAITYSTQQKLSGQQADLHTQNDSSPSTITLMEIAG